MKALVSTMVVKYCQLQELLTEYQRILKTNINFYSTNREELQKNISTSEEDIINNIAPDLEERIPKRVVTRIYEVSHE